MNKKMIIFGIFILVISSVLLREVLSNQTYNISINTDKACYVTGQTVVLSIHVTTLNGNNVSGLPIRILISHVDGPGFFNDFGTYNTNVEGKITVNIPVSSQYFQEGSGNYYFEASDGVSGDWGTTTASINLESGVAINCGGGGSPIFRKQKANLITV